MVVLSAVWKVVAAALRLWWRAATLICLVTLGVVCVQLVVANRTLRALGR